MDLINTDSEQTGAEPDPKCETGAKADKAAEVEENCRLAIEKWEAYSVWSYEVLSDVCTFCRNPLKKVCINCEAELQVNGVPTNDCSMVVGKCQHSFHKHCINHWLTSRVICPLDGKEWEHDDSKPAA